MAGAVWAAVASSVVDHSSAMLSSTMDQLRGGDRIRELESQLKSSRFATAAFIPMAFRTRPYCFDQVRNWSHQKGYVFTPFGDPNAKNATIEYFGVTLVLRCIGAAQLETTYLVIMAPENLGSKVDALQTELFEAFKGYSTYPGAVLPSDLDWFSDGPYSRTGYIQVAMPFSVFQKWAKGEFPQPVIDAMWQAGSKQAITPNDRYSALITTTPGASVVIRNPEPESFAVLDSQKGWHSFAVIGGIPQYPAPDTMVRARALVSVSGRFFGKESASSAETRYLGLELESRLKRIPGVVDDGQLDEVIRNW